MIGVRDAMMVHAMPGCQVAGVSRYRDIAELIDLVRLTAQPFRRQRYQSQYPSNPAAQYPSLPVNTQIAIGKYPLTPSLMQPYYGMLPMRTVVINTVVGKGRGWGGVSEHKVYRLCRARTSILRW